MRICLDAGALIALERDDRAMWTVLKIAGLREHIVLAPSTVVAQVWRGSRRQAVLARALTLCAVASFDGLERDIGVLCGRTGTTDICDAHVALVATRGCDVLYTGDPDDLEPLIAACPGPAPAIRAC